MAYIFMDESGCLGFDFSKAKTSKYFIITFLCAENNRSLEKIIKKIFQSMPDKIRRGHPGVLHSNKELPKTRIKVLQLLRQHKDVTIFFIRLNKRKVYTDLYDQKAILYNYVTNILLDRIFTKKLVPLNSKIQLVASRRETNRLLNHNFKSYLLKQNNNKHKINFEILIKTPAEEKSLQIVDFVSWASFRKHEYQDESYYNMIKPLIIEDTILFGKSE